MGINKNFVVKNGLEVDENLIYADGVTDRVGIGTTNPLFTFDIRGTLDVSDATTLNSTLDVDGATTLNSTLDVDGVTTLNSTLDVDGATTLNSTLDVSDATNLNSTLDVDGATTLNSTLNVSDATNLDSTLDVDGATTLNSTLDVIDSTSLYDTLYVQSATTLNSTLDVSGATTLNSTLDVDGYSSFASRVTIIGTDNDLLTINQSGFGNALKINNYKFSSKTGSFTASSGVPVIIDTYSLFSDAYKTVEYTLNFVNGDNIQAQKVLVLQNSSNSYCEEYGIIFNNAPIVSIGVTIINDIFELYATPESDVVGNVEYKLIRGGIE
jgi:hypothetical protein